MHTGIQFVELITIKVKSFIKVKKNQFKKNQLKKSVEKISLKKITIQYLLLLKILKMTTLNNNSSLNLT